MRAKQELDGIIRIIDKFDGLLSLLKGVEEISISPSGKALLSATLPSLIIFNCIGDRGQCSVKIPMQLIEDLAQDPTLEKSLANLLEKMILTKIQPSKSHHDYFYLLEKEEFARLS